MFHFQGVTGFVRKRSSKCFGGGGSALGLRMASNVEPDTRYSVRQRDAIFADFLATSPFFQILHLLLVSFLGHFSFSNFEKPCLCFSVFLIKPLRENILLLFFVALIIFCCCSYLSSFLASFLSTHFSDILFSNPRCFHFGPVCFFSVVDVLISFVLFVSPSLASFFVSSCVWCFGFRL